ncbi:YhgE/Pip domain-containing protein [Sporolactobacillus spathodeae]|uniref:Membrane protein n=1 Tax=Sporolactobacillus spathodeae TaxID=1465502 RepID=A0ABS2Q4V3_9BACL|nr:YhgE/Pip domain-containing protein [Sporolactobacillus spathodeae]MBM7656636.1 putative membrane protein [Sporolactobacillus spathodeae]
MNVIHLIVAELKAIVAKPHNIVVMLAVMCVPLLYAGMFLYSFWDAFGETGKLPVAVVNQDRGAEIAGKELNAGSDLVKNLKKNKEFKWQFVSEKEAQSGFKNNRYFMIVRIPSSFSKNATTLADGKVKPAHLIYRLNADYNFIASRMADAGVKELKSRVSSEITKTYAESMYQQLDKLTSGLNKASKGSNKLAKGSKKELAGLNQLKDGFKTLTSGTSKLKTGAGQLANGTAQLNSGASALNTGVKQYTGAVSSQIVPGSSQLTNGLNQLNSGIKGQNLVGQVNQLNSGMQTFASSISGLQTKLSASIDPKSIGKQAVQSAQSQGLAKQSSDAATLIAGTIQSQVTSETTKQQIETSIEKDESIQPLKQLLMQSAMQQGMTSVQAEGYANQQIEKIAGNIAQETTAVIGSQLVSNAPQLQKTLQGSAENTINSTAVSTASQIKNGIISGLNQKDPSTGLTLNSAAQQLAAGTQQLAGSNGIPLIASSVSQAAQGANQLNSGLNQLNNNSASLASGSEMLAQSTGKLAAGASQLNSGLSTLATGQNQLAAGAGQLSNGAQKIYQGNSDLGTSLSEAHAQLAKTPTDKQHANQFAAPVQNSNQSHQAVDTFGSGFAPYFISLGLYVGALLLTIIYDLGRPAGLATGGWNIALSKFFVTLLMSIGQSLLIDIIVLKGLGLHVSNVPLFIGFTILTSMSFMAIIEWLAGSFDNEGRFVCIVILILQLVSSGGAYAIELIPKWLQGVAHFLPMTYSVNGFRNIIDGHQPALLAFNISFLWVFIIVALGLSIVTFSIKFNHKLKAAESRNQEQTPLES